MDVNLGPRITVQAKNIQRATLEMPEEYFVSLATYKKDNPGKEVAQSEIVWEQLNGVWIEGVPCLQ